MHVITILSETKLLSLINSSRPSRYLIIIDPMSYLIISNVSFLFFAINLNYFNVKFNIFTLTPEKKCL